MFKTSVTKMLGIEHPIICGGLNLISGAELTAAVSNAGGLGIFTSAHLETPEALRDEIRKTKSLTAKPFGVNISLFPAVKPIPNREFVEVIVEEGVKVVESSGMQPPTEFVPHLKEGKVTIIHKAATVRHALKGQEIGADIVAIVGMENGGATGMEDVSTSILVQALVDVARVPVLAGGGFADGRGLVAALAFGAEGIIMGTRFMATRECPLHDNYKQWLLDASERDTILVMRSLKNTHRVLRSKTTEQLQKMEARGASLEEMLPIIGNEAYKRTAFEGDFDAGQALAGEVVGLIHDIPTIKDLIDRIIEEAQDIAQRLHNLVA
ncbi:NAD(P)H-dependent flavin oxidoreductase [Chloroflexota bacterium]